MSKQISTAVLGDIGGHHAVMMRSLQELGVDTETLEMPQGLNVVQLGDLVRVTDSPGLDSLTCVQTADRLMFVNPGQWLQIIGNHDAALIGGPRRAAWRPPERDNARDLAAADIIRAWWRSGRCRMAHGLFTAEYGPTLLTHGGLTRMRWRAIGSHQDPRTTAACLNEDVSRPPADVFLAGSLARKDGSIGNPDVTWAEVGSELYGPWIDANDSPFTQIHGHASPWNWQTNSWWPSMSDKVISATKVQHVNRRTETRVPTPGEERVFVSTDWNLGEIPLDATWPLLRITGI